MDSQPSMFKLNINCFNDIFDYLSLNELRRISQTCKTLKEVVGQYFGINYGKIPGYGRLMEDHLIMSQNFGLSDFIQKLIIGSSALCSEEITSKRDFNTKFVEISLRPNMLTEAELHRLQFMLNHVETLVITCDFNVLNQPTYEIVPDMCHSLKRLYMSKFDYSDQTIKRTGNKWLLREYPKLEHLRWSQSERFGHKIDEIKTFFERNPNVRSFATNQYSLWESRHLILESGVKLDDLTIEIYERAESIMPEMITQVCNLLNELFERGVYKRLHLNFKDYINGQEHIEKYIDQIIPLDAIKSLHLREFNVNLSKLTNIVELKLQYVSPVMLNSMARQLVNLERIDILNSYSDLDDILPFIYHAPKLKKMKVLWLVRGNFTFLDLVALNVEREKLPGARRLTIFVEEKIYLETKWRMNGTVFRLIEVRRETSHEWGHHFRS